ncbi:Fc.00g023960.m01.CDS01 [Cosmosporella sp. VM-42]
MNSPAAYTPLESLFLFQSIISEGLGDGAFARISELLINNGLIKASNTYDPARLSPDALEQLFLLLLREEIKRSAERPERSDGSVSPNSRKRKLGSPPLPTLRDVREHVEKIPVLVDRLYAVYKDHMVKEIREDETRFAQVQREIQLLERTERERRAATAASRNGTPALAPREAKPVTGPNRPSPTPTPTPVATPATAVKRAPTPQTPVLPPKPPTPHVATPTVAPPSHLPAGTTPIRPTPSPKPTNGTGPVLQAPTGVPTTGPCPLQPPAQPPKQAISPRPEVGIKPKDGSVPPQTPTPAAGALKWEKPYQPPQATQTPPPRQFQSPVQQGPAPPPGQQHPQQHSQLQQQYQQHQQQLAHSQPLPQQQQWYPQPTAQYTSPTPGQGQQGHPHPPQHQLHPQHHHPQHQQHPQPQPRSPLVQHSQPPQRPQPPQQAQQYPQHVQHPPHPHTQHPQHQRPQHVQHAQPRPPQGKPVLVPPQNAGQLAPPLQPAPPRPTGDTSIVQPPQVRPPSTTPVHPPSRPTQPPQPQVQQAQHVQHTPRPIASASPTPPAGTSGPIAPPQQRWPQAYPQQHQQQHKQQQQQAGKHPTPNTQTTAPPAALKDKGNASPYVAQAPRPAIPEHIIRQAASTPGPSRRITTPTAPHTPVSSGPALLTKGFATRWSAQSTPSTPRPMSMEPESPAYEPMSPPRRPAALPSSTPKPASKKQAAKSNLKIEASVSKSVRGRGMRSAQKGRGISATPSLTRSRRSQSVMSHTEEASTTQPELTPIIKNEAATPRPMEEAGDTTADESGLNRPQIVTPSSVASRLHKRKRQDTPTELPLPTTQVLWTRGFTKVSSSALDQISSHRDANMFATAIRQKDAPNYRQIVLQPQDITSIRSAIKHGNKSAVHAAQSLTGGDPGTAHVWLPLSDELVPPKGIINSAQLERELVHMFCNAIMYNPDPDRGPGPGFMKRSQDEEEEVVGYRLDENGIVKNTRSMFVEVEKLLGDLRSAEKERSAPAPSVTRPASVATPAEDTAEDDDEAGDVEAGTGTVKRRRIAPRG